MKYLLLLVACCMANWCLAQVDLGEFNMSNDASPAFLLVEESPTAIYTPSNPKALIIHALDNLGESLSIEVTPYFFINTKKKGRTYFNYIGIEKNESTNTITQKPFRGLNTTTISFAYVDKEFAGIGDKKKTYSVGMRTTLLRFYDKTRVYDNAIGMANALSQITVPVEVLQQGAEAIQVYYKDHQDEINALLGPYQKTIKPVFRVDAAGGYSALFKENTTDSGTVNRFGGWLTAEGSLILNEGADSDYNNYLNVLLTARYIEDGFNLNEQNDYFNTYYRDFGGKVEFEFGKFALGYEYISRNGAINSERSVGNIKFMINKDISITGGFGKDFPVDNNLVTIFGINWGINLGDDFIPITN